MAYHLGEHHPQLPVERVRSGKQFEMSQLIACGPRVDLLLEGPSETLARVEAMPPTERAEVSPDWLARVRTATVPDPWSMWISILERESGAVIGGCAFKGPPDADGTVELAYGIEEEKRGRGFATEAAAALVEFAFQSGRVQIVCAHSKSDNPASGRVLEKTGFAMLGEVTHPEDGLVLRWEKEIGAG